jgi:MoaD family protein
MKVKGYLTYRDAIGKQEITLGDQDKLTLRDLLGRLGRAGGLGDSLIQADKETSGGRVIILVNGRHSSQLPDGMDTLLKEDDEVAIFPPLAGG